MEATGSDTGAASLEVLAEVAGILEHIGLQEESELPAQILAEFMMDSQKKDRLLCSQLQVVDFLQNFLAQEDPVQGLDPLASEDLSRQKAIAAKEQWKELKATYREHVEAIKSVLTQALTREEEVHRKRTQLQEAHEQLQAKKQIAVEKFRAAQKQRQLQQEKHLQHLGEVSTEVKKRQTEIQQELERLSQEVDILKQQAGWEQDKLQKYRTFLQLQYTLQGKPLFPEAEAKMPQELPLHLELPEAKTQLLTQPQEQNTGDKEKDCAVSLKVNEASIQPAGDMSLPQLPEGQGHEKGF
ncbi:ZW10 interactor isoform X1 [Nycticebus coucang]|uniref:ZW10 interactor isoform X1 n=1 Tax=Nycticebus coucang TaxID=9470 RepID=UPI00234CAA94|nr:ZW10 interactor isoform X1 [Nycticebus coucang]XP_053440573.1 ZW10 interactor isoform X1 [Nycticebus coucang]XP_053440574.1 ZW10 interactor isoform X1 [Nycticebus coucang]